jgi:hypothetical protein
VLTDQRDECGRSLRAISARDQCTASSSLTPTRSLPPPHSCPRSPITHVEEGGGHEERSAGRECSRGAGSVTWARSVGMSEVGRERE